MIIKTKQKTKQETTCKKSQAQRNYTIITRKPNKYFLARIQPNIDLVNINKYAERQPVDTLALSQQMTKLCAL